jgi:hypothetical protein
MDRPLIFGQRKEDTMRSRPASSYREPNLRFELAPFDGAPKIQRGQMKRVYEAIKNLTRPSLTEIVDYCMKDDYDETFRDPMTDPTESVIYHLKRLEEGTVGKKKGIQSPVISALKS